VAAGVTAVAAHWSIPVSPPETEEQAWHPTMFTKSAEATVVLAVPK